MFDIQRPSGRRLGLAFPMNSGCSNRDNLKPCSCCLKCFLDQNNLSMKDNAIFAFLLRPFEKKLHPGFGAVQMTFAGARGVCGAVTFFLKNIFQKFLFLLKVRVKAFTTLVVRASNSS